MVSRSRVTKLSDTQQAISDFESLDTSNPLIRDQYGQKLNESLLFPTLNVSGESKLSTPQIASSKELAPTAESVELTKARQISAGIGGVNALLGIMNAFVEYDMIKERAKTNIQLAHQQAYESIALGKEVAFKEESKGISRGKQALLSAVAQGQEVSGEFAQNLQKQEELFGVYSAMQVEVNALRQAYGHEAEATIYESDIRRAKIERDNAIFNNIIQGGASVAAGLL